MVHRNSITLTHTRQPQYGDAAAHGYAHPGSPGRGTLGPAKWLNLHRRGPHKHPSSGIKPRAWSILRFISTDTMGGNSVALLIIGPRRVMRPDCRWAAPSPSRRQSRARNRLARTGAPFQVICPFVEDGLVSGSGTGPATMTSRPKMPSVLPGRRIIGWTWCARDSHYRPSALVVK